VSTGGSNVLADVAAGKGDNFLALTSRAGDIDVVNIADSDLRGVAGASSS